METIFSLVTKPINQNVGIIRISGPESFDSIKELVPNFIPEKNKIEYQKAIYEKDFLDDVLVLSFISPHSFTGENVIEIQSHGSIFILNKIINHLKNYGLKQSDPGEFMKQAYMNGKIDLSQAEAINTLILSEDKSLAIMASKNLNGEQSEFVNSLINILGQITSRIQISIDYPENTDLPEYNLDAIRKDLVVAQKQIIKTIYDSQKLVASSKGLVLSIIGIPNSGKSTLLNALVKEERAIVSNIEGTTRDIVESIIYINGIKFTVQDTAGVRFDSNDEIEIKGIEMTKKAISKANIIIFLQDGTKPLKEQEEIFSEILKGQNDKVIIIESKCDLTINRKGVEAANNKIDYLIDKINEFVKNNIFDMEYNNSPILITENQINNFQIVLSSVSEAIKLIESGGTPDIIAIELESAMIKMGEIIGKEINEEYIQNLFSNFCVGK